LRDDRAVATARRAGLRGADVADEGSLHRGDLAVPVAGVAGLRGGVTLATVAVAPRAQHYGVDLDRLGGTEGGLGEGELDPYQRVLAAPHPGPWSAPGRAAALPEHRPDQVGEVEAGTAEPGTAHATHAAHAAVRSRLHAHVVRLPL